MNHVKSPVAVDAASETPVEAATQATDDPVTGHAALAVDALRSVLHESLRFFEGRELASFRWISGHGTDTRSTRVILESVEDGAGNTARFHLTWSPDGADPIEQSVAVELYNGAGVVTMRARVFGRYRTWTVISDDEEIARWTTDDGHEISSAYPGTRGAPGIENLGRTWYRTEETTPNDNIGVRRACGAHLPPSESLVRGWPQFGKLDARGSEGWIVTLPGSPRDEPTVRAWGATVLSFAIWSTLVHLFQGSTEEHTAASFGLPPKQDYFPRRPVDLNAHEVQTNLHEQGLLLPWHVIEAACSSLNAGKHVIFSGPPGCGKSKLAVTLGRLATGGAAPLLATASGAWTSGDLIGRYMPTRSGSSLEFHPGHFLRAVESSRWLVIDEVNRANIDECFGELFSVLAHDTVELPFRESTDDAEVDATVRIVPALAATDDGVEAGDFRDYQVSPSFRMIGTMNDADRSSLHALSFAFQRRFDIIRVEAPAPSVVWNTIESQIQQAKEALGDRAYLFRKDKKGAHTKQVDLAELTPFLQRLFANTEPRKGRQFTDLVAERIIGLATVNDVIRFVAEGMRAPVLVEHPEPLVALPDEAHDPVVVAASYLAMGVVLSVFPQLESLDDDHLERAVAHIVDTFRTPQGQSLRFLRIASLDRAEATVSTFAFRVERVTATDGDAVDADGDGFVSIPEFLVSELRRQFRGNPIVADMLRLVDREPERHAIDA